MIHFATSFAHPDLTADDRPIIERLSRQRIGCRVLRWRSEDDNERVQPDDLILVRSCWDYHLHPGAYVEWLDRMEARGARLANGHARLAGTLHKRYLLQLEADGLAVIPPTRVIERDSPESLDEVIDRFGSTDLIVKPAVSLSAHETWRVECEHRDEARARFDRQSRQYDVLVQRYLPQIEHEGELSLVFFAGRYSHAVRKRPRRGDFRVQMDHGGSHSACVPAASVVDQATRLLAGFAADTLYARVDGVIVDGHLVLMEFELIDPVLFLSTHPGAMQRFCDSISALVAA